MTAAASFLPLLLLLLVLLSAVGDQLKQSDPYDYCDPKFNLCRGSPADHTMCKYPVPGLSPQCTPTVHEPLSATEKKRIMFWHNKFRSNVANGTEKYKNRKLPTSSNMRQIYWDKELEAIATRWAEQCTSTTNAKVFDKCRNTRRFQVSQNVGTRRINGTSIDKQAPQIIITWYKESKDFDPALVEKFIPGEDDKISTRQFANIIWAETYAIGCARVVFQENLPAVDKESKKTSVWTVERLVCNYGPGGNEIGKSVYKRGISCENCPEGTQCSLVYPGLCAIPNAEKLESQEKVESPESKEAKTESEASTREMDFTSESSDAASPKRAEEDEAEEEEKWLSPGGQVPESGRSEDGRKEEEGCEGEECPTPGGAQSGDAFEGELPTPRPTAGIKCRGFGMTGPPPEKDLGIVNNRKRKWIQPTEEKADVRKNGEPCHCFVYNKASTDKISFLYFFLRFSIYFTTMYTCINSFITA